MQSDLSFRDAMVEARARENAELRKRLAATDGKLEAALKANAGLEAEQDALRQELAAEHGARLRAQEDSAAAARALRRALGEQETAAEQLSAALADRERSLELLRNECAQAQSEEQRLSRELARALVQLQNERADRASEQKAAADDSAALKASVDRLSHRLGFAHIAPISL